MSNLFDLLPDEILNLILDAQGPVNRTRLLIPKQLKHRAQEKPEYEWKTEEWTDPILQWWDILKFARTSRRILERLPVLVRIWNMTWKDNWYGSRENHTNINAENQWDYVLSRMVNPFHSLQDIRFHSMRLFGTISEDARRRLFRWASDQPQNRRPVSTVGHWQRIPRVWHMVRDYLFPIMRAVRWAAKLLHRNCRRKMIKRDVFDSLVDLTYLSAVRARGWVERNNWIAVLCLQFHGTDKYELLEHAFKTREQYVAYKMGKLSPDQLRGHFISQEFFRQGVAFFKIPSIPRTIYATATTTATRPGPPALPQPKGRKRSPPSGAGTVCTRRRGDDGRGNGRPQNGHHAFR